MASQVQLKLVMDTDTGVAHVLVRLLSNVRRGLWAETQVPADATNLEHLVEVAAHRLSLHQITSYKDKHDPRQVAAAALEALREIKIAAGRASRKLVSLPGEVRS